MKKENQVWCRKGWIRQDGTYPQRKFCAVDMKCRYFRSVHVKAAAHVPLAVLWRTVSTVLRLDRSLNKWGWISVDTEEIPERVNTGVGEDRKRNRCCLLFIPGGYAWDRSSTLTKSQFSITKTTIRREISNRLLDWCLCKRNINEERRGGCARQSDRPVEFQCLYQNNLFSG